MPNDPAKQTPELTLEQVRELTAQVPNIPVMYFNYVRLASSFFDLRMFFGNMNINAKGQQSFQEELCVVSTIEFAKILRDSLTVQIDTYEKKFGLIRQPPAPKPLAQTSEEPEEKKKKRHN